MSNTNEVQFSIGLLKIKDENFNINTFSNINSIESKDEVFDGKTIYNQKIKKDIREDRFITFYFEEGSIFPHPKVVYDTDAKKDTKNSRKENHIERDKQMFVLLDILTQRVFISNYRRRKEFELWISEKVEGLVFFKNIISKDNFIDGFKSIGKIKLSAAPNAFTQQGPLKQYIYQDDFHNTGMNVKSVSVSLDFHEGRISELFKTHLKDLVKIRENQGIDKLVVSGRSDSNFERIYNSEGIVDKFKIQSPQNKNGYFEYHNVFVALIAQLKIVNR